MSGVCQFKQLALHERPPGNQHRAPSNSRMCAILIAGSARSSLPQRSPMATSPTVTISSCERLMCRSLALTLATGGFRDRVAAWVLGSLEREGFEGGADVVQKGGDGHGDVADGGGALEARVVVIVVCVWEERCLYVSCVVFCDANLVERDG